MESLQNIKDVRPDTVSHLVERVFAVEDVVQGSERDPFLVCYHGKLLGDSAEAYDQLNLALKPYDLTPLFRWDANRQAIYLVQALPKPKAGATWVNILLFVLTFFSVLLAGASYNLTGPLPSSPLAAARVLIANGWPFAASLIAILGTHEMGHYLAGRYHKVHVSLPYFIPLPPPISQLGTMGAFINLKEPVKNRRVLLDIGITGPLAGLAVAIPVLIYGLSTSPLVRLPASAAQGPLGLEGNSLLYLFLKYVTHRQLLPAPASYGGMSPLNFWLSYFFTGRPLPWGAMAVQLNSVAWAGWVGLLVTTLNLIPAGQLDGGHVLYTLLGKKNAQRVYPFLVIALLGLSFFWPGWLLWAFIVLFLGRFYAEPLDQITPLNPARRNLARLALLILVLTFMPVPTVAS